MSSNYTIKYLTRIFLLTGLVCRHLADSASDSVILGTLSIALLYTLVDCAAVWRTQLQFSAIPLETRVATGE